MSEEIGKLPGDVAFGLFEHANELFVRWEIERRIARGERIPNSINKVLVIMHPDKPESEVRLNEEVGGYITVALVERKLPFREGQPVKYNDIDSVTDFRLGEKEDPDCGYIFIFGFGNKWFLKFDCRYYKRRRRKYIEAAREFLQSADDDFRRNRWRPFVDNLFSATELLAKVLLMRSPPEKFRVDKTTHGHIKKHLRKRTGIGNYKTEYSDLLLTLDKLRSGARYLQRPFAISETDANYYKKVAEDFLEYTESMLGD